MTFEQVLGALILAAPIVWLLASMWGKKPDQSNNAWWWGW
jgi:hypothetical protein